jgi:GNAT superfamily N-acetyltransferase
MAMLEIRAAQAGDVSTVLQLIRDLAEYENEAASAEASEADLLRDGFGEHPKFHCLLAEWDGKACGLALYYFNYSTWKGRAGIFLDDLFVRPEFRGRGIGKALLVEVARVAVAHNCGRYEWLVLDWNTSAIEFYESLGARRMQQWVPVRVEGEALLELARQR